LRARQPREWNSNASARPIPVEQPVTKTVGFFSGPLTTPAMSFRLEEEAKSRHEKKENKKKDMEIGEAR
jgi:hypothetical protein